MRTDDLKPGDPDVPDKDIHLWYGSRQEFGRSGHPQRAVNILGHVTSPAGLAELIWSLNGVGGGRLPTGPDDFRLHRPGDFNIEVQRNLLNNGENVLHLHASWTDGTERSRQVTLTYHETTCWHLPFDADFSAGSKDRDDWTSQVQVVDGLWKLTEQGLRTAEPHYDRLLTFGDVTWTDYRTRATVTIHRLLLDTPGRYGGGIGLLHRWSGHVPDACQPHREWRPNGAIAWYRAHWDEQPATFRSLNISDAVEADLALVATKPVLLDLDRPYVFEFGQTSRMGPTGLYHFRLWPSDDPGRILCDLTAPAKTGESPSGSALLIALYADMTLHSIHAERF